MIPIKNKSELTNFNSNEMVPLECQFCHNIYYKTKNEAFDRKYRRIRKYCSRKCYSKTKPKKISFNCMCCNKHFLKAPCECKRTKRNFCSKSCAATYNNRHKTTGTRRSKLESWIEIELTKLYPTLEIHYNKTNTINAELDIYIPSLKLAFEFNGIFHYEPIYGEDKLKRIKNNDDRKFQACIENNIEMCIIDVSKIKYFKLKYSEYFLKIIKDIINKKLDAESLSRAIGFEPSIVH